MCTDEHTYIYTHTNIHIRKTYIYTHVQIYIYINICIYMHTIYIQNMTKQNIHGNIHAYTHILNL